MRRGYSSLRCGLLGERLGHSFSVQIHRALADYSYELIELPTHRVEEFVKSGSLHAFNVTVPYKQTVIPFLDRLSPEAERIGAVNTVVRSEDGTLVGYNTDYYGFDRLLSDSGISVEGKKVLILGSGGTSRTVRAVLADRGVRETVVISRSGPEDYGSLHRHADAEVIVNTTPVGMFPRNGEAPLSLEGFPRCEGVLDVIYNPARSALLMEAEARGIPCRNGLLMLVAQAVKAFEYFTGSAPEEGAIRSVTAALRAETENTVLIGMPGCGKTTAGRELAKMLNRPFADADRVFTDTFGRSPARVITEEGEEVFRRMEHRILTELGAKSGTVIACGGGAVTRSENYAPLRQNGVILYLRRDLSQLSTADRPLSRGKSPQALFAERRPLYESFADLTVDITPTDEPSHTATAMQAALEEYYQIKGE